MLGNKELAENFCMCTDPPGTCSRVQDHSQSLTYTVFPLGAWVKQPFTGDKENAVYMHSGISFKKNEILIFAAK